MYLCATCKHPVINIKKIPFIELETGTCTTRNKIIVPSWVTACSKYEKDTPTPPPTPVPSPEVSRTRFDIMVLDGLNETRIRNAVSIVPQHVSLSIISPDESRYEMDTTDGDWKGFTYPRKDTDNLIVVFDGPKRGFKYGGGACIWDKNYHRIGLSGTESSLFVLGLRFEHEILHIIEMDYIKRTGAQLQFDADQLWTNTSFRAWLEPSVRECFNQKDVGKHSPQWERLFYSYLWLKYGF